MKMPGLNVANKLQKVSDKQQDADGEAAAAADAETRRGRTALAISVLAALLALAGSGSDTSSQQVINANIKASNLWAFYQAKNARQTMNALAADDLEAEIRLRGDAMDPALKAELATIIDKRRKTAARYESEPDPNDPENLLKGEGKKQLAAQAHDWEDKVASAQRKGKNFGFAGILLQVGIVLGSVAILANNRGAFYGMLVGGLLGSIFLANAYLSLFALPI